MTTYREQASTTVSGGPDDKTLEVTPEHCCSCYFSTVIFVFLLAIVLTGLDNFFRDKTTCYAELFAHSVSVSVSNVTNVSTADWRTVFIAKSPVTRCKLSLHSHVASPSKRRGSLPRISVAG
ncbi:hypothetical protein Rs2_46763 [Raphanus sativus]|nr:hypothetical protein Rs2_46763 [Raphanus sativus]